VPYLYLCVYLLEDVTGEKVKELRSTEPWSRLELWTWDRLCRP